MPENSVDRACSVARTLEVMGDRWTFLLLHQAFLGVRRFDDFLNNLGIARNILTGRLRLLVAHGILERQKYQGRPARYEYRLSEKGRDLYPVSLALMRWGDRWLCGEAGPPLLLFHTACGHRTKPTMACSRCGRELAARGVRYESGPGAAGKTLMRHVNSRRRPPRRKGKTPCSVARTLDLIGDRWTFLVLREAFFGVRRFEDFRGNLGIARNILSARLKLLVADGILEKRKYQDRPARFEYRFTEKGIDLYSVPLALMRWGDRWLSGKAGPPLLLFHKTCGHDITPAMTCSRCGREIGVGEVRYETGPGGKQ